jgi:hypothetical protein
MKTAEPTRKTTESTRKDNAVSRWLSFRPEIKVVDCTIRDGGLMNNHHFEDNLVNTWNWATSPRGRASSWASTATGNIARRRRCAALWAATRRR